MNAHTYTTVGTLLENVDLIWIVTVSRTTHKLSKPYTYEFQNLIKLFTSHFPKKIITINIRT